MATFAVPITVAQVSEGASNSLPTSRRLAQRAGNTGTKGSPVIKNADGFFEESGAIAGAGVLLAGFAQEPFQDLGASGVAETLSAGTPQNQANATVIPMGAPLSDGNIGVFSAEDANIFAGTFGNAGAAAIPASTDVGKIYGITKDSGGVWYVDKAKTTAVGGALVTVVGLHPQDTPAAGSRVLFRVNRANQLFAQ